MVGKQASPFRMVYFQGRTVKLPGGISYHSIYSWIRGETHQSAGANCMLEYKLDEATELLRTNESNARTTLKSLEEDEPTRGNGKGDDLHMDVSENRGFSPQIIHFNRVFHYKPSILGYPYFWKPSDMVCLKYVSVPRICMSEFCLGTIRPAVIYQFTIQVNQMYRIYRFLGSFIFFLFNPTWRDDPI